MNSIHTNIQSARFKKGDAFVQCDYVSITFMEINEVDQSTDSMDFCTVTWYCSEKEGVNIQRRFSMAARDGKFCNFEPIARNILKEAKKAIREFEAKVKSLNNQNEIQQHYTNCSKYLRRLIGDEVETDESFSSKENKLITHQWLDCSDDNYWVENDLELGNKYITIVCITIETYYDKENKTIAEQFIYLRDNCPYSWSTLAKSDAKYMVIEKPKK